MANKIQVKRSAVAAKVPTTTDLDLGEIAVNTYDGKLYIKKNVSGVESIVQVGGSSGSSVTVAATAPGSPSAGDLWWDSTNGQLKIYYNDGNTSQWIDANYTALPSYPLAFADGGTGKTTAPAANAALMGYTSTATAAGTTTLTSDSSVYQLFTGTSTQTVKLPDTSTLATGWTFHIVNNSTGNISLQTSTTAALVTVIPQTTVMATCVSTSVNTTAAWEYGFTDFSGVTGTGNVVLATDPTLTNPLTIGNGGTGLSTLTTAYGVICAGTTATGNLQNAGAGTSGQVLVSGGASALPSWKAGPASGPTFSSYLASNQSVSSGVTTKISFDTEDFDTNTNNSSGTFTPTVAGYYIITVTVKSSGSSLTSLYSYIYKNGSQYVGTGYNHPSAGAGNTATASSVIYFNGSSDYVEGYGYITGTSPAFTSGQAGGSKMTGCFLRGA